MSETLSGRVSIYLPAEMACERCGGRHDHATELCCSSHGKRLCHACYRRTHFVEVCSCSICNPPAAGRVSA